MPNKGYQKYKKLMQAENISMVWRDERDLQENFTEWSDKAMTIKTNCESANKKNNKQKPAEYL